MKVFWAWQADLPGKIARHFVREALEEAIDELKQPRDIEEPPEESRRNDLHLDHVEAAIFLNISCATSGLPFNPFVSCGSRCGCHSGGNNLRGGGGQTAQATNESKRCDRTWLCVRQAGHGLLPASSQLELCAACVAAWR
jgi:hypothetical protein